MNRAPRATIRACVRLATQHVSDTLAPLVCCFSLCWSDELHIYLTCILIKTDNQVFNVMFTLLASKPGTSLRCLLLRLLLRRTASATNNLSLNEHFNLEKAVNFNQDDFLLYPNFISEDEEKSLLKEVDLPLRKCRYASSHWDYVRNPALAHNH